MAIAGAAEPVGPPVARSSRAGALRPRLGAEALEHRERVAERPAGVGAALGAAQALAVQELGAGGLERLARLAVELQRAGEVRVDLVVGRHQPADALDDRFTHVWCGRSPWRSSSASRGGTSSARPSRHRTSSRSGA